MDISHWDVAIHYGVQLAQYCDQTLSCNAISPRSPPLCSLALRLRNTKVPVLTHEPIGYPKMDISHWDAAIHYGVQLAQYCDQTLSCNAISRRSPPLCSLALRLRNTKVPVLTDESIGYSKMDISHWDAAIHYGIQVAQYCDQTRSFNAISRRSPPVYSLAQDSGTPNYLCWLMSPYGTRKWTSAIGTWQFTMAFSLPNIVIKPYLATLFHRDRPLCAPLPYDSGTPKYLCRLMSPWDIRKWTSAIGTRQITMAFSLSNIVIKPDRLTLFHWDRPLCTPLP